MHQEESDEHMPDQCDLAKSAPRARLGAFGDVHSATGCGGEVDWPLDSVVSTTSVAQ